MVVVSVVGKVDWVEPLVVGVVVQSLALVPEEAVDFETDELEVLDHGRLLVLPADDSPLKEKERRKGLYKLIVHPVFKADALMLEMSWHGWYNVPIASVVPPD